LSYLGRQPVVGNFAKLDAITTSATTTFNLTNGGVAYYPQSPNHCLVSLNGILQAPTDSFTISGSTIIFSSALTTNDVIDFIIVLGDVLNIGTPSDNTVSLAKLTATGTKDSTTFLRGDNTFSTVSSDFVKLATTTVSSAVSSVAFDGYFNDSTYNTYKIFINNLSLSSTSTFGMRVNVSNSAVTTSTYYFVASEGYLLKDSSGGSGYRADNAVSSIYLTPGWGTNQTSSTYTNNFEIMFQNPTQTSSSKAFSWLGSFLSEHATPYLISHKGFGYNTGTSALTGVTFINTGGGNITGGTFSLYGVKK